MVKQNVPNPGSTDAITLGCKCPVLDNAHGRGYMGGVKDDNGEIVFVFNANCDLHNDRKPLLNG